eukprot:NODE_85_length_22318_cov_0.288492.p9 type:complete len:237 gc:universal NODE_85_length_22318_cov_0.288492:4320-5030(+)
MGVSNMNVIEESAHFDPTGMQEVTSYEGLNVYYDGTTYYCKGVISLSAENIFNFYQENDHKDLMKALNEILSSALLWGSSRPSTPSNSPVIDKMNNTQAITTWTVSLPFVRQRVYAYTRQGFVLTTSAGQKAYVLINEAIKEAIPIGYFAYQVFNYAQKAVLIQQTDDLCFVYVSYYDPDNVVPTAVSNLLVQMYVPYFIKRIYKSCGLMNDISKDVRIAAVGDALEQGIQKGFVL